MPRPSVACALLLLGAVLPATSTTAAATSLPPSFSRPADAVINVASKERRSRPRDCVPTNGPFGFYGNIWCEPPSETQYIRNLGAGWPMETPPAIKRSKPSTNNYDW